MGRVPFRVSYRAFPGPLLKRGRGSRPLSFPAIETRAKGREKIEMKVVKAIFKVLLWIILLPLLPIRLGWKWSKGATLKTFDGDEILPGVGRLIMTFIYAIIMYGLIGGPIIKVGAKSPTPIVEKTVDQTNVEQTDKETGDVLRDN